VTEVGRNVSSEESTVSFVGSCFFNRKYYSHTVNFETLNLENIVDFLKSINLYDTT